jgi:sugar phosphate isomerase/epimerase
MLRRTFLQGTSAVAAGAMAANAQSAGIRLGFDSFSIRDFGWKDIQLIDYAASLKLDTVQLSSLSDYESLDPAHLAKVKDHAQRAGVTIDAGIYTICELSSSWNPKEGSPTAYLRKGLNVAQAVGARVLRCAMGTREDRPNLDRCMEATVKALRSVRSEALDLGVRIAVENHAGDTQAREMKALIEAAGTDFVGSCLDAGNPLWAIEDPLVTLEILGPYVITTHIRDTAVFEHPRGAAVQWVALGDGSVDLLRFTDLYRKLCPNAAMQLEIITGIPSDVVPYREPDFWKVFPRTPAREFARFLKLAKSGHPYIGPMVIAGWGEKSPTVEAAFKEQQRTDLERSLEYAKKVLSVGVRWKS